MPSRWRIPLDLRMHSDAHQGAGRRRESIPGGIERLWYAAAEPSTDAVNDRIGELDFRRPSAPIVRSAKTLPVEVDRSEGCICVSIADVAVIIRTKDRPDFLARALQSVTSQSHTEWECVVVNDGGDPTPVNELIDALDSASRGRIRAVHSPETRGRWKSANAGVLQTSAPLIVLHDDDDSWHPEFLRRSIDYLAEHPQRAGVVSRIEIVWERRAGESFEETGRELFQPQLHDLLLSDALLFNRHVPIAYVYRRSLHEELGLYDESLPVVGDWAFNLKVLSRHPLPFLPGEPMAYWHQRVESAGADGNSVISSRGDHDRFDALIRDEALRAHASQQGLGLALYLTKFIDQRFVDVENGIRSEVAEASLLRRLERRFRRPRDRRGRA